jgi:hypothetical protein
MKKVELPFPELGLIAATRGMLGVGVGLLIAERLAPARRRAVGWALLAVGAASTVPLMLDVLSKRR